MKTTSSPSVRFCPAVFMTVSSHLSPVINRFRPSAINKTLKSLPGEAAPAAAAG